jgi:hypothetical protein
MADEMVLQAQKFVNKVHGARIGMTVEENGRTGWPVMYALTRVLQWKLEISALPNSFGPTTLNTLQSKHPKINTSTAPSRRSQHRSEVQPSSTDMTARVTSSASLSVGAIPMAGPYGASHGEAFNSSSIRA